MKYIPNSVTQKIGRQILLGRKYSPTVLFAAGVVGAVTSTVLACRATLKLDEVLKDTKNDIEDVRTIQHPGYSDQDRRKDLGVLYIRRAVKVVELYGPALTIGALSIAALTGSHNILTKRNAGLTAAYAALEKGFKEYRQRVIDEYGEDKDCEFRYGAETHQIEDKKGNKKPIKRVGPGTPSIYARFFDQTCPDWQKTPEYNLFFVRAAQNYANDQLKSRGHVLLNEVYDSLGMERSKAGCVVGWVYDGDGDNFIDFGVFNGDNPRARDFVNGREGAILLDFNVDGVVYDKLDLRP
jgi:hypothetical protein